MESMAQGPPGESFKERKVLVDTPDEKIIYSRMSMGKFMSDRDQVIRKMNTPQPDGSILVTVENVEHPDAPEVPGVVRMQMFKAVKVEQVGEDIHLTDFSSMDMKGYFPMRLMNMMIGSMMPKMLKNQRKKLDELMMKK